MATMPARPVTRPAAPQKPKKSPGMMVGLIIAIVLALAGFGGAGALYGKQSGLTAENNIHTAAAATAAEALAVAVDTNTPTDWTDLWSKVNSAISVLKGENQRQTERIGEMEGELQAAAGLQTTLQSAQGEAQRNAQQVATLTAELNALKENSAAAAQKMEAQLATAQAAAAKANTQLADILEKQGEAETPAGDAKVEEVAPAKNAPNVVEEAATETDAEENEDMEPAEPAAVGAPSSFDFPAVRNGLLKTASYDPHSQTLQVVLSDDTPITYREVPSDIYERLTSVPTFETFYRMKIMGAFPTDSDDKAAVRAASKHR